MVADAVLQRGSKWTFLPSEEAYLEELLANTDRRAPLHYKAIALVTKHEKRTHPVFRTAKGAFDAESWQQFWAMGGYAGYVWSSYAIAAVVIVGNIVAPVIAHRQIARRIKNEEFDD